jgi:hypothetical protein
MSNWLQAAAGFGVGAQPGVHQQAAGDVAWYSFTETDIDVESDLVFFKS